MWIEMEGLGGQLETLVVLIFVIQQLVHHLFTGSCQCRVRCAACLRAMTVYST